MGEVAERTLLTRRLRLEIHGAVQGVGFRPFVYRLATGLGLAGWVINDTRGVFVEVEGAEEALQAFLQRLPREKPPLAIIQSMRTDWLPAAGATSFEIRHSSEQGSKTVLVLPDVATCEDCLSDIWQPDNRRYRYPFTNCTNCGPRFSIVQALPYDRPHTTMARFALCTDCRSEYEDPANRRFHAQPNACPACGPTLAYYALQPPALSPTADFRASHHGFGLQALADPALQMAATALRQGMIVAVKGLGGFQLMADARAAAVVARLRQRKRRPAKPLALMVRDLAQATTLCEIDEAAASLLSSPQAPIVLLPRRPQAPVAANVAPGNPYLGIMLPTTPLHHLLLHEVDFPLVATSGNLTDEPICTDEWEAMERLAGIADSFLVHNRPIARHVDDSVSWLLEGEPRFLRRARGYAPLPVSLPHPLPTVLAVGGHLKNTIALSVGPQVFISQHIGDLDTAQALAAFERVIADFLRLYEAQPVAAAHDLHPDYGSTRWLLAAAEAWPRPLTLIGVQHHHAHLAACLADNQHNGPALGMTWDGTGYGPDGSIWGGEALLGDAAAYRRVATLRSFRLPGGDAAIKAPCRSAFAVLWELFGDEILEWDHLPPLQALAPEARHMLAQMLAKKLRSPLTTSMGRLFDAVAALLGLHQQVSFEGQAAMALEYLVDRHETGAYPWLARAQAQADGQGPLIVWDWAPVLQAILHDIRAGVAPGVIAARFHRSLVDIIVRTAQTVGETRVALSGGVFQNRILCTWAAQALRQAGFTVLLHRQTPPNDGGISLGQVAVAAARLRHTHTLQGG